LKFRSFNVEYKKRDLLIAEQKSLIEERNKNIKTLQERIKSLEKKLEIETNSRDKVIKDLKTQFDSQSSQLATLTFQLNHLNNKTKQSLNQSSNMNNDVYHSSRLESNNIQNQINSARRVTSPKLSKTNTKLILKHSDSIKENENAHLVNSLSINVSNNENEISLNNFKQTKNKQLEKKSSLNNSNEFENTNMRPLIDYFDSDLLNTDYGQHSEINNNNSNNYTNLRSPSNLGSAHSDRSQSPRMNNKVLPPVVKRPSEIVPPPDPKPFLQSAASTLHTRAKKEIIQRRTLISLPPIKPFELAVESPHKMMHSHHNGQSTEQKNNSAN
jgi:hypothetical protein